MTKVENIIEKIKKLLAMANDNSTTEAEAMLFSQKAQKLLADHNLEMADIKEETVEVKIDETMVRTSYAHIKWRQQLLNQVAEMFFCKAMFSDKYFTFVGRDHNREVAVSMFQYLERAVVRLSKNYSKVALARYHFEKGCGGRLAWRVMEETAKLRQPVSSINPGNLPALYTNELALADQFMKDKYKNLRAARSKKTVYNDHSYVGSKAANTINLNTQIGQDRNNNLRLENK